MNLGISFCENLVDLNEARLHEATQNPHTQREFFLSVNGVSRWQAVFELGSVSCSRRIFIVRKMTERLVSGLYPYTQDSSPVIMVFLKSGSLFVDSSMSRSLS